MPYNPTILAYQYEGDYHCVACTQARFGAEAILEDRLDRSEPVTDNADNFGVPFDAIDREDNEITRIYDTDDWWEPYAQDGQNYASIECGSYYTWEQRSSGEVPYGHVGMIAEWENPDFEPCDCGDGCAADDCQSCEDRRRYDEQEEDDDPDYVRMSGCTCAPCLAGDAYITGMDDAQYDPVFVAQSLIPPFTGRRASRVENATAFEDIEVGDEFEMPEATEAVNEVLGERIVPGSARDVTPYVNRIIGWEDESEDYGQCESRQPNGHRYLCERVAGHPGWHGAFGSAVRREIAETAVWR